MTSCPVSLFFFKAVLQAQVGGNAELGLTKNNHSNAGKEEGYDKSFCQE